MPAEAILAAGLLNSIKNSPTGKFPVAAGKAGIKKTSPLGKQIKESPRGKLPPMLGGVPEPLIPVRGPSKNRPLTSQELKKLEVAPSVARAGMKVASRGIGSAVGGMVRKPKPKR
jgi:hypothetical protein